MECKHNLMGSNQFHKHISEHGSGGGSNYDSVIVAMFAIHPRPQCAQLHCAGNGCDNFSVNVDRTHENKGKTQIGYRQGNPRKAPKVVIIVFPVLFHCLYKL